MNKLAGDIIKRPVLTEKGSAMNEDGNTILFEVALAANKIEIRHAIEKLYNVKVSQVRTQVVRGKLKRVGRSIGMRSKWKKAMVTLAEGSNIDFFAAP